MRSLLIIASAISLVRGQRPANTSVCNYYSQALIGQSNATTQYTLLTLLVNTAVIGNYTTPNKLAVPGILAPKAEYNGTAVNLAKYFDGSLMSTNTGKGHGMSVNFLDGGGADPLKESKPANNQSSHQYTLLTHLYSFFGLLLGCSEVGQSPFPVGYHGDASSMYEVHKFMALDAYDVQYFIQQVGLSAASFGVAVEDVESVGHALQALFGLKCAPATSLDGASKPQLQSICNADDCPQSPNATCSAYGTVHEPASASSSSSSSAPAGSTAPQSSSATKGSSSFCLRLLAAVGLWLLSI